MDANKNNKRWWILAALCCALFTVALDMTILNVALPTLATALNASTSELQWFANAFNLVLAVLLLPAGLLGDRFGRKKWLIIALVIFGIGSVGCAFATSSEMLISMRVVLGVGSAFLIPLSMSILPVLFEGKERTRAMMLWGTVNMIGIPLGPIIGGMLLKHYEWGSVFLVNVPFVIVGLLAVIFLMSESRSAVAPKIDYVGILTSGIGLGAITYAFIKAGETSLTNSSVATTFLIGIVIMIGFILWQRRSKHPLIQLSLFRSSSFTWGTILSTVVNFAMFGLLFTLPLFFQAIQGSDTLGTGLRLLPLVGGLIAGAKASDSIAAKLGRKYIVALGFLVMAIGIAVGSLTGLESSYLFVACWMAITGIGLGLSLPTSMDAALGALSVERSGIGSALIMALRQVGGTIGIAILGTIINTIYIKNLDLSSFSADVAEKVEHGVSVGVAAAKQMQSDALLHVVRNAFVNGMGTMLLVCAGIACVGVILSLIFLPRNDSEGAEVKEGTLV